MRYTQLGHSGIRISQLCLGGMSFGEKIAGGHQWTIDPEETRVVIARALEQGINFIDTANCYAAGTSEEYIGRALRDRERDLPIVNRVSEVAQNHGVPMAQVALAWHWARGVEAPIVGCSKPERVDDAVAALDVELTSDELAYLEGPYVAHELVGPLGRPGEKPLAGTLDPNAK